MWTDDLKVKGTISHYVPYEPYGLPEMLAALPRLLLYFWKYVKSAGMEQGSCYGYFHLPRARVSTTVVFRTLEVCTACFPMKVLGPIVKSIFESVLDSNAKKALDMWKWRNLVQKISAVEGKIGSFLFGGKTLIVVKTTARRKGLNIPTSKLLLWSLTTHSLSIYSLKKKPACQAQWPN